MLYTIKFRSETYVVNKVFSKLISVGTQDYRTTWSHECGNLLVRFHIFDKNPVCSIYDENDSLLQRKVMYREVFEHLNPLSRVNQKK